MEEGNRDVNNNGLVFPSLLCEEEQGDLGTNPDTVDHHHATEDDDGLGGEEAKRAEMKEDGNFVWSRDDMIEWLREETEDSPKEKVELQEEEEQQTDGGGVTQKVELQGSRRRRVQWSKAGVVQQEQQEEEAEAAALVLATPLSPDPEPKCLVPSECLTLSKVDALGGSGRIDLSNSDYQSCGADLHHRHHLVPLLYYSSAALQQQPQHHHESQTLDPPDQIFLPVSTAQIQMPLQDGPQPAPRGTKRPHSSSPLLSSLLAHHQPPPSQSLQITQEIYSTCRSVHYSITKSDRGEGSQALLPLVDMDMGGEPSPPMEPSPMPAVPKMKKIRILYSNEQLEHLEGVFQKDHYPDTEKRKMIACSVGVSPPRIMVWFQNRRAKWKKKEGSMAQENHANLSMASLTTLPLHVKPSSYSGHYASLASLFPAPPPSLTTPSTQNPTAFSALLTTRQPSPAHHQMVSQAEGGVVSAMAMPSPPPLRRAILPPFANAFSFNPSNNTNHPAASPSAPPVLNTPASALALFMDGAPSSTALVVQPGSGLTTQPQALQADPSSLFDYRDQQQQNSSSLSYQLQTSSYAVGQPQQGSVSRLAYLTPSPFLTPNAPDSSNPGVTTYRAFGLGVGSTGTYTIIQSQNGGQILLQPTSHPGGLQHQYQSPWGNMYSQPAAMLQSTQQQQQCDLTYPGAMGLSAGDHQQQLSSTNITNDMPHNLSRGGVLGGGGGGYGGSFPSSQQQQQPQYHTTQTQSCSSSTTTTTSTLMGLRSCQYSHLQPVSTLWPSLLRAAESSSTAALGSSSGGVQAQQKPPSSQLSPESPPPAPPFVKMEHDSPTAIQSHFHCDFSPIHF